MHESRQRRRYRPASCHTTRRAIGPDGYCRLPRADNGVCVVIAPHNGSPRPALRPSSAASHLSTQIFAQSHVSTTTAVCKASNGRSDGSPAERARTGCAMSSDLHAQKHARSSTFHAWTDLQAGACDMGVEDMCCSAPKPSPGLRATHLRSLARVLDLHLG